MARISICLATSSVESVRLKPAGGFHAALAAGRCILGSGES